MSIKKILTAAAAALSIGAAVAPSAADAAPFHGYGYFHSYYGPRHERAMRVVDHRVVFDTLRFHRIRYVGNPYFVRGHYVVRSYDRFGRVVFVEVNPYTGRFIGFVRP
ncbi:MAG: hypothetical protein JO167_02450 [Alphaproteobacteria bacterium]|nr:hypothetical protein [Alphaproteobacteria bacterium]MBV9903118.1 hypothetical protein [Alphaproteobacteria bacterium]